MLIHFVALKPYLNSNNNNNKNNRKNIKGRRESRKEKENKRYPFILSPSVRLFIDLNFILYY